MAASVCLYPKSETLNRILSAILALYLPHYIMIFDIFNPVFNINFAFFNFIATASLISFPEQSHRFCER